MFFSIHALVSLVGGLKGLAAAKAGYMTKTHGNPRLGRLRTPLPPSHAAVHLHLLPPPCACGCCGQKQYDVPHDVGTPHGPPSRI